MSVFKDKAKTKDGRQWRFKVYYHNSDGKLVPYTSKRFLLEKEAKAEERVFLMNRNNPVKKKFHVVAEDYFNDVKTKIRESTYISYKRGYYNHIYNYFGNKYIDEINVVAIEKWKNKLSDLASLGSCNRYYVIFNEIFKFANKKYELNYNPVQLAGRFKKKNEEVVSNQEKLKYITYEQFNQFISVIDDELWHCFFTFLFFTGMRKGEVLALTWKEIDFVTRKIIVNKTVSFCTEQGRYKITATKTGVNREIIMSNALINELKHYKSVVKQYGDFSENWFIFGNGDVLSEWKIRDRKKKYFKKANLNEITTHQFRHSHVSLCVNEYLKSGQTDTTKFFIMMSQRMGHCLRVMQEVYMHLFPTTQDSIVDLLDNLDKK